MVREANPNPNTSGSHRLEWPGNHKTESGTSTLVSFLHSLLQTALAVLQCDSQPPSYPAPAMCPRHHCQLFLPPYSVYQTSSDDCFFLSPTAPSPTETLGIITKEEKKSPQTNKTLIDPLLPPCALGCLTPLPSPVSSVRPVFSTLLSWLTLLWFPLHSQKRSVQY